MINKEPNPSEIYSIIKEKPGIGNKSICRLTGQNSLEITEILLRGLELGIFRCSEGGWFVSKRVKKTSKELFFTKSNLHNTKITSMKNYHHGRYKSSEWSDSVALDLQKEIKNLRKKQGEDPNTFDRFAMK